ncbi:acetate--CoA ligase [Halorussus amylolyticus]|uniref:acetate--CoA ligase n=1 Tax=Halorussus amylolyticus TaxID=1126242 RepID=UPI001047F49D|nr:acetate--CoA ligase [Halorussus amylolyticus]
MSDDTVELEARLEEQEAFEPPEEFVEQANVSDASIYEEFEENWPECWEQAADLLTWEEEYDAVLDDSDAPFYEWFTDGKLNASANCLDRHLDDRGDEVAIDWIGEKGETRTYTYGDLHREVNEFAAALRELGVEEDDVVTMYMPMIPELPVAMLACARIGAPHSVVFAGFSAEALATRMESADSEYLVTCDGYYRRGDLLKHKEKTDEGLAQVGHDVSDVVVVDRGGDEYDHDLADNEHDYGDLVAEQEGAEVEPVTRDAEDMLFLMYTSGTTGEPKGVKHTTGGYLSYVSWTSQAVLDIKPDDTYWCSADIGWITGHSYIVYGPLALGTTSVMYEGTPDYPERDRLWEIVEEYGVDIFYTAPTAIRAFMKWGTEYPDGHDLSSLRLLGTVGEPINPRAWKWYYKHIGDESCPIVDTWWQTETGGMMVTTLPGVGTMKPGSAGPPLPGIDAKIVDTKGDEVEAGRAGYLTVNKPWPGMLRTVYKNDDRYISEYWEEYSDSDADEWVYFPEDGAKIDDDGYITVLGRVDDVLNVSGHRLGTMEIESAIVGVEGVAEAAVVGGNHPVKGEAVYAYVITEEGQGEDDAMRDRIVAGVEDAIGPIARPEQVVFTPELPKTRSGKIMRRLLEDIANEEELGDTSTLRNPDVVADIQAKVGDD